MLIKIGTLGKMKAEFAGVKKNSGYLVATLQVKEGMKWEVVSAVSYSEAWKIARAALKPGILWYLFTGWARKKAARPPKI